LVLGDEAALRVTAEQQIVIYDRKRRSHEVPISRLGDIELAGVPASAKELAAAQANREGGGLRTYSYDHEMRIFAHCVATRRQPTCTAEIGLNTLAITVVGTEAQLSRQYKNFTPDMFA
jgi:hypothetical protein